MSIKQFEMKMLHRPSCISIEIYTFSQILRIYRFSSKFDMIYQANEINETGITLLNGFRVWLIISDMPLHLLVQYIFEEGSNIVQGLISESYIDGYTSTA